MFPLQVLKDKIKLYSDSFSKRQLDEDVILFQEVQNGFSDNWDLTDDNLYKTFDESLTSKISNRLWINDNYYPKERMLQFIKLEPEQVKFMFQDLMKESKDLTGRVGRFIFLCDELLKYLKKTDELADDHYHNNRKAVALYLALAYPDKYCLFDYPKFYNMLTQLKAPNIPTEFEIDRYFKGCRTIAQFIYKDERIQEVAEQNKLTESSVVIVYDFMCYLSSNPIE